MKIQLLILFFALSSQAKSLGRDANSLFADISSLPANARLLKSTSTLVGAPTGLNPLGEGSGIDSNPLMNFEKFDCTTYVETNLALAFSKSAGEVQSVLTKIRYSGDTPNYFERNHFMVSDWIPSNTTKGFVVSITSNLVQDKAAFKTDRKALNKTTWFFHRVIDLMDQQKKSPKEILTQLAKVPTLPLREEKSDYLLASYFRSNVAEFYGKLPEVSVVMFIRNILSVPTLVNHMGFVIKKNGTLYLNHAPQARPWRVQEIPLEEYFKDMDAHRAPIEGLLFLEVGKG